MIFNATVLFPVIIFIRRRGGILKPKRTEMLAPANSCDVNASPLWTPANQRAKIMK